MKVGTIVTASDLNPLYMDFIPNFIKAWSKLFPNADVIIVLVASEIPESLVSYSKNIRIFKPIDGINTAFQAQCIRLLYPQYIERNEGVLITDMDMLPMNRFYYENAIQSISNDTFVCYRDCLLPNEIPICYVIALPNIWKEVFEGGSLEKWHIGINSDGRHGGVGWNTDQSVLIKQYNEYSGKKTILNDSITKYNRLDRIHSNQFANLNELRNKIKNGEYSDYHCLRPYSENKEMNDFIVESLPINLKVLVLIISDDCHPIYEELRSVWRMYMNLNPIFKCFFITSKSDISEPVIIKDTLYVPGIESFIPGIFQKTIKAIDYFKNDGYDFIVRTNLSSVWNFNKFGELLKTLPKEKVYYGISADFGISGAGITMSKDVYMSLLHLDDESQSQVYMYIDDVLIGNIMNKNQIPKTPGTRSDITSIRESRYADKSYYHYRCRQPEPRLEEPLIMKTLVESIYNNTRVLKLDFLYNHISTNFYKI